MVCETAEPPNKAPRNSQIATRIMVCNRDNALDAIAAAATELPSWKPFVYVKIRLRKKTRIVRTRIDKHLPPPLS
jgi:hypothetical protein